MPGGFTVEVPISAALITDLMITAFEGGINDWCKAVSPIKIVRTPEWFEGAAELAKGPWYADPYVWASPFQLEFHDLESEETWTLNEVGLRHGLQSLPKLHPFALGRLMDETYDAGDADAIIQIALLGEVRFG